MNVCLCSYNVSNSLFNLARSTALSSPATTACTSTFCLPWHLIINCYIHWRLPFLQLAADALGAGRPRLRPCTLSTVWPARDGSASLGVAGFAIASWGQRTSLVAGGQNSRMLSHKYHWRCGDRPGELHGGGIARGTCKSQYIKLNKEASTATEQHWLKSIKYLSLKIDDHINLMAEVNNKVCAADWKTPDWPQTKWKKALRETQTLRVAVVSGAKNICPATDPFTWVKDGQNLISWRRSIPLPTNPVWWGSHTHAPTNR